jgi:hypothetical protein
VDTVPVLYFTRRHKLDRCAQRIADGQTGVGRSGIQFQLFLVVRLVDELVFRTEAVIIVYTNFARRCTAGVDAFGHAQLLVDELLPFHVIDV